MFDITTTMIITK